MMPRKIITRKEAESLYPNAKNALPECGCCGGVVLEPFGTSRCTKCNTLTPKQYLKLIEVLQPLADEAARKACKKFDEDFLNMTHEKM